MKRALVIVACAAAIASARGARAQPAWSSDPDMFRVGEAPGWEAAVDVDAKLLGEQLGGAGVELEGANRHDDVLAHVVRVGVDRYGWDDDSLTSTPGHFDVTRVTAGGGERACAFGVLCLELGAAAYVEHETSRYGADTGGGVLITGRAMLRVPIGAGIARVGFGGEAGPASKDLIAFLGLGARW